MDADRTVFEPGPEPDPDSPLAFSLEGLQPSQSPDELRARTWWPGWNSGNGLHKFGEELEALGPARHSGVRVLDAGPPGRELPPTVAPARFAPQAGDVVLVAMHLIYGSEPLSMYTPGIAGRAPAPFIGLSEEDAERLEVDEGEWLQLWLPWMDARLRCVLVPSLVTRDGRGPRGPPRRTVHLAARPRPPGARGGAVVSAALAAGTLVAASASAWYWQLLTVLLVLIVVLTIAAGLIWYERRLLSLVQDRYGPNRVGPAGLLQVLADTFKILFKEDWTPPFSDRRVFVVAPSLVLITALLSFMVVPVADGWVVIDLNIGLLFFLAMSSVAVYSVVLAGWSSRSKYSLVGGLRAAAQMVSYEVFMGLSLIGVVTLAGSFNLSDIVEAQQRSVYYVFPQFIGFVVFLVAGFAETRRIPFDLTEAESELVAGYHTEYSGMKFGLFLVGEYVAVTLISAFIVTLFFGGWLGPWLPGVSGSSSRPSSSSPCSSSCAARSRGRATTSSWRSAGRPCCRSAC